MNDVQRTVELTDNPIQTEFIYKEKISDYLLVCKPLNMDGVILLDPDLTNIYNLCNGFNDIKTIVAITKIDKERVIQIIAALWNANYLQIKGKLSDLISDSIRPVPGNIDAWFHITNSCNLDCHYCYINKTKESMTWDIAKQAIDALTETAISEKRPGALIKLAGGEPLLKFQLIKSVVKYGIQHGKKHGIKNQFHLITNGTLITKEVVKFIKENDVKISVSLDGIGIYNDRQRFYSNQKGSFEIVDKNIKMLIDQGVIPFVLITVTSHNLAGLPDFTRYLLKNNIGFRYSLYRGSDSQDPKNVNPEEAIKVLNQCYDLFEQNLPKNDLMFFHQLCDIKFTKKRKRNCGIGSNGVIIGHKGQVAICQILLDQPIGFISKNANLLEMVRDQNQFNAKDHTVDDKLECKSCLWRYMCGGGCPLLTKAAYNSYDRSSPYCEVFQAIIPRLFRIIGLQIIEKSRHIS